MVVRLVLVRPRSARKLIAPALARHARTSPWRAATLRPCLAGAWPARTRAPGLIQPARLGLHALPVAHQLFRQLLSNVAAQRGIDQTGHLDAIALRHASRALHQPGVDPESQVLVGRAARQILLERALGVSIEKPGDRFVVHLILGRPSMFALGRRL